MNEQKTKIMKNIQSLCLLTFIFIAGITTTSFSQVHAAKNQLIFIDGKGVINNSEGTALGYIDKNDIVKDNTGKELYFIDKNGNVISAEGKKLGMAKKNGFYYNLNGQAILNTKDVDKEKCAILDPRGHNLGTIHKNYKLHACAAHCFFLEQQKKKEENKKTKA